jgi:hypothetical protein
MLLRKNDAAAVEMTAFAAGAGPPANKMATRLIGVVTAVGESSDIDDFLEAKLGWFFRTVRRAMAWIDRQGPIRRKRRTIVKRISPRRQNGSPRRLDTGSAAPLIP